MKNVVAVIVVSLVVLSVWVGGLFSRSQINQVTDLPIATPSPSPTAEVVNIKASFKIITGNITRSFVSSKYHNQSPDVYIEASDPTVVHVTKSGITWADFFNTLPMKLTKDCLITGDGEKLCTGQGGSLRFYLNGNEDMDLLEKEIKDNDQALITFK